MKINNNNQAADTLLKNALPIIRSLIEVQYNLDIQQKDIAQRAKIQFYSNILVALGSVVTFLLEIKNLSSGRLIKHLKDMLNIKTDMLNVSKKNSLKTLDLLARITDNSLKAYASLQSLRNNYNNLFNNHNDLLKKYNSDTVALNKKIEDLTTLCLTYLKDKKKLKQLYDICIRVLEECKYNKDNSSKTDNPINDTNT